MSEAFLQLVADPAVWAVVVALGGLVRFYVKKRIIAGVDHQFAVRLEDHRQSLHLAAEAARYHFERDLSQANLYTAKAHAAAVEVHQAMRKAHGSCLNLRGLTRGLTFEEFDEKDLKEYMDAHEVPNGKQREILARLASDRGGAIDDMKKYVRMLQVQLADRDLANARNAAYSNELYFDDATIEAFNHFFDVLGEWMGYVEFPPETRDEIARRPTKKAATAALEVVHTLLRNRLRGGIENSATSGHFLRETPSSDEAAEGE